MNALINSISFESLEFNENLFEIRFYSLKNIFKCYIK